MAFLDWFSIAKPLTGGLVAQDRDQQAEARTTAAHRLDDAGLFPPKKAEITNFADNLLAASEDASLSRGELRDWMRRAALRLRKDALSDALRHIDTANETRAKAGEPLIDTDHIVGWGSGRPTVERDK